MVNSQALAEEGLNLLILDSNASVYLCPVELLQVIIVSHSIILQLFGIQSNRSDRLQVGDEPALTACLDLEVLLLQELFKDIVLADKFRRE